MQKSDFQHVSYLWDQAAADRLDPVGRLVYRSNLLGADQRITNTGGGNTSSKVSEKDPLTGQALQVLWVKGSGGDLRTSTRENFSSLEMDKLNQLQSVYDRSEVKGPKTEVEDAMVGTYSHCTFNLNPRPSSIDTPLHAYIPHKYIDHMHPNAVIAIAACKDQKELCKEIWDDDVEFLPWQRPGFDLGLKMQAVCRRNGRARGILMGQHGLINWADDERECYELTLSLIEKAARFLQLHDLGEKTFGGQKYNRLDETARRDLQAEILPWLRGQVSQQARFIGTVQDDDAILDFVGSVDAERLAEMGTSCPDHFLRTKIKPLFVDWDPASRDITALQKKLGAGIEQYRKDYAAYYKHCKHPNSPAMRDPNPTVVLVPGLGMFAWGKNKSESRVTAEFYNCAVAVMRGAEAVSRYVSLPKQEAFDIEYWLLEEAKLKRMPAEKELARKVIVVVGAGSGIGQEVCKRIIKDGATVVSSDLDQKAAQGTAKAIEEKIGPGIGVAGSGISACGDVVGLGVNITNRASIQQMLKEATLAYGGIDSVIITAGVFVPPDKAGYIPDEKWAFTFSVNVTGPYLVADEAGKLMKRQNLPATIVLTTSVNAVVAKKGSLAYDTSKAAANHLVRELAVELAPLVRVNGVAPATVVQGSSMFPRDRVIASLTKYDIAFSESESEDELRNKLAAFYAGRTLTRRPITPSDQAEAFVLLVSDRLGKTTGQVLTVDGGLHEAFLR